MTFFVNLNKPASLYAHHLPSFTAVWPALSFHPPASIKLDKRQSNCVVSTKMSLWVKRERSNCFDAKNANCHSPVVKSQQNKDWILWLLAKLAVIFTGNSLRAHLKNCTMEHPKQQLSQPYNMHAVRKNFVWIVPHQNCPLPLGLKSHMGNGFSLGATLLCCFQLTSPLTTPHAIKNTFSSTKTAYAIKCFTFGT